MIKRIYYFLLTTFFYCTIWPLASNAQTMVQDGHLKVALRMIGHEILLHNGDSTSRVLPILKFNDRYAIEFAEDFEFDPEKLVTIIDSVVFQSQLSQNYLVEIQECSTANVVYSFEVGSTKKQDIIPCRGRLQPTGCYTLFFTFLDHSHLNQSSNSDLIQKKPDNQQLASTWVFAIILLPLLLILFWILYQRNKKRNAPNNPNHIKLGQYFLDKQNMALLFNNQITELSSKESDLLLVLLTSVNQTVERDFILNAVWGDEGDYVGRTLDVFISKLRKKLQLDPNLKIINIRGIGYKLVVNG